MFESIIKFFKKIGKQDKTNNHSKDAAKERLHLVLMQDRANVSADFLDLMKQEIIEVIKKYIDVDENEIDVRLANKTNEDGTTGAPALYANIPIISIKEEAKKGVGVSNVSQEEETKKEDKEETTLKEESEKEQDKESVSKEIENTDKNKDKEDKKVDIKNNKSEETSKNDAEEGESQEKEIESEKTDDQKKVDKVESKK